MEVRPKSFDLVDGMKIATQKIIREVARGTGTPEDRDDVNRREDYECDWVSV